MMTSSLAYLPGARLLVVGDCMLDRYVQGNVGRISPEAPVPVVSIAAESACIGGAGNVAAGIAALGGQVTLAGIVGNDENGRAFVDLCSTAGIGTDHIVKSEIGPTITKTRILADRHHQLLRLDQDGAVEQRRAVAERLQSEILPLTSAVEGVVIADYDKGSLPDALIQALVSACQSQRIPCVIDAKRACFSVYRGATVITPNVSELERATGRRLLFPDAIAETAASLRKELSFGYVLCTCGAAGMVLASPEGVATIDALVRQVADVTGAGDTVVATLAVCLARHWDMNDACRLAAVAAGLAVAQPRTYAVPFDMLARAWGGVSPKILDAPSAIQRVLEARRNGKRVVFTNGCFDILHAGHLACLEHAKRLGDLLVLGLNSDASVRLNKGNGRPRIKEYHRAALLAGLQCVDIVVLFDEQTPETLIRQILPDVLVKGGDYQVDSVIGAGIVRSHGGRVVVVPLVEGLSSTAILDQSAERARQITP